MFMESWKPEQRTFPRAAACLPGLITTSNRCSQHTTCFFSALYCQKTFWGWGIRQHTYLNLRTSRCVRLSESCSKCSLIGRWPTVTQPVSLETGCPLLRSCPSPNEILVRSLTLLPCRQQQALVPWQKDQICHAAHLVYLCLPKPILVSVFLQL